MLALDGQSQLYGSDGHGGLAYMGDISAAKRHHKPFLPDQDTLWQVEQIFAYGSRVDWLSYMSARIARDPQHLDGCMEEAWLSLGAPWKNP